jgi:hypothetical protein
MQRRASSKILFLIFILFILSFRLYKKNDKGLNDGEIPKDKKYKDKFWDTKDNKSSKHIETSKIKEDVYFEYMFTESEQNKPTAFCTLKIVK